MKLLNELLEGKWDYPGGMKGKGAATKEPGGKGQKGSKNRKSRKAFRKAEKAKAHQARMRGELDEGVKQNIADYWAGKAVLTPRFIQSSLTKFSLNTVTRHLLNQPEKVKKHVANSLRKWVKKNKGEYFEREIKNILYSLDGTVTESVTKTVQSIKELKVKKAGLRADYEAAVAQIDDQIDAIRNKRGQKLKDPDWSGYKEPGRDRDEGPRGSMG